VYLGGWTKSTEAIATSGAHQTSYGGGSWDAFLVKFSQEDASEVVEFPVQKILRGQLDFALIPNPADGNVLVRIWAVEETNVDVVLSNILGVEQVIVKDKEIKAGTTDVSLDLNECGNGFYLITVRSGKAAETKVLQVVR